MALGSTGNILDLMSVDLMIMNSPENASVKFTDTTVDSRLLKNLRFLEFPKFYANDMNFSNFLNLHYLHTK